MSTYCVNSTLKPDQSDLASAFWYSLGMLGCEEEMTEKGMRVKVYFRDIKTATIAKDDLENREPLSAVLMYKVEDQDWNKKWRESMEPVRLAPRIWVSPLWLPPPMTKGEAWIKIEPKMAFGTGHHETTRLAGQAILSQKEWLKGKTVLDIGTGSGILCFVSQICGSAKSVGVEKDPVCLQNLAENHSLNASAGKVEFLIGTLDCLKESFCADLVVMNMIMSESEPLLFPSVCLLKTNGVLVWSGILVSERDSIFNSAKAAGLRLSEEMTENEWWCGIFYKGEDNGVHE